MTDLIGESILSVDQFDREMLVELFTVADLLQPVAVGEKRCDALEGAMLANLFFEPSTRTRTSFGTAFHRLGGKVVETADGSFSSLVKGESLLDTARVVNGYADIVVVRHQEAGSVAKYAEASDVPVINAGDGGGEHPTQALLDVYTMTRELKRNGYELDGINIALVGDLKHGRTVHSLAKLVNVYEDVTFTFISPAALRMPAEICELIVERGNSYTESALLRDGLPAADVIYSTRIQEERFDSPATAHQYRGRLAIDRDIYERFAPHLPTIMHPLPRDSRVQPMELAEDLEDLPSFAVFRQAHNGVPIRMALFAAVLGVESDFLKFTMRPSYKERQENWREQDNVLKLPSERSQRVPRVARG